MGVPLTNRYGDVIEECFHPDVPEAARRVCLDRLEVLADPKVHGRLRLLGYKDPSWQRASVGRDLGAERLEQRWNTLISVERAEGWDPQEPRNALLCDITSLSGRARGHVRVHFNPDVEVRVLEAHFYPPPSLWERLLEDDPV